MLFSGTYFACGITVVDTDFDRLVDQAECILHGKVLLQKPCWTTNGPTRSIVTRVSIEVETSLKGRVESPYDLWVLGGTVGDATLSIPGLPSFEPGEEVLLFVKGNKKWLCPLVGIYHGKYSVRPDKGTGKRMVHRHDGKRLSSVEEIGKSDPPGQTKAALAGRAAPPREGEEGLTLEEFLQTIRSRLTTLKKNPE